MDRQLSLSPATTFEATGPEILATRSIFYPNTEQMMGWKVSEKGFRITLSPEVPVLIRENLGGNVDAFLADHGHKRSRHRKLGASYRRPESAGSHRGRSRSARRSTRRFLGLPEESRESLVGIRLGGAGRCDEESASGTGHARHSGGDGPGILFRACTSTMVRSGRC